MKRILSLLLTITVLACGMINAAAETPSVTIEGIENGQTIEYGTEVAAIVSAASSYNKITLFLNGEEAASAESATERFVLSDVPSGRNVLKAVAEGDYDKAVSEEVEFYYLLKEENIIASDDFEEGINGWTLPSDGSLKADVGESYEGKALIFAPGSSKVGSWPAKPELKEEVFSQLPANGFSFEFDTLRDMDHATSPVVYAKLFMRTDKTTSIDMGGIRRDGGSTGTWTPSITLHIKSNDGYPVKVMDNQKWYHVKYDINLAKGTAELFWAEGKGNSNGMTSVGVLNFTPCTAVTRLHFEGNGYGHATDSDPLLMIDDILFKESKSSPYLTTPSFEHYGIVADAGKIPANPTKISIPFSVTMNKDTLSDDAFKFTSEGIDVDVANLSYDKDANEVVIVPKKQLTANKPYKLTVQAGTQTASGMDVPTELVYSFDTPLNDFDILTVNAVGESGPVEIKDIQPGVPVNFECLFQNLSSERVEGVALFAVYENGFLAHLDVQPFAIDANIPMNGVNSSGEYVPTTTPDYVEVYLWKSMTERISLAPSQVLK